MRHSQRDLFRIPAATILLIRTLGPEQCGRHVDRPRSH